MLSMFRRLPLTVTQESKLARAAGLSALGSVSQSVTRSLSNIFIGRLAGPAVLGVVSTALSLGTLLSLAWPATGGNAAAKFIGRASGAGNEGEVAAVSQYIGRQSVIVSTLLCVVAIPLWHAIDTLTLSTLIGVPLLVLGLSLGAFARGVHYGLNAFARSAFWDVTVGIMAIFGVIAVLLAGMSGPMVLVPIGASYIIYAIACWPRGSVGVLSRSNRKEINHFVLVGTIGTIASAGFLQLALIVVRMTAGVQGAGQYAAALALASPAALIGRALSTALYPRMARDYGRGNDGLVATTADQFTRLLCVGLLALLGCLAILRETVVTIVWGSEFSEASMILPILLMAVFVTAIRIPSVNFLSSGPSRGIVLTTRYSIAGLLVGCIAWVIGAKAGGPIAVAAGFAVGAICTTSLVICSASRMGRQRWASLFIRSGLSISVVGIIIACQEYFELSIWGDVLLTVIFLMVWALLLRRYLTGLFRSGETIDSRR